MKPGRVLYLAGETAIEYRWKNKQLAVQSYALNQAPLLQQHCTDDPVATLLLLDLSVLELRTDSLPAVRGEDLRQLRARRLERLFPGSPYCNALQVGADPQDAARQLWLFHGLALPEAMEPWLSAVRGSASALAGISALPLFVARLLQEIHHPEQLLMVVATPAGWRLLYAQRGRLLFSRLLPFDGSAQNAGNTAVGNYAALLNDEIERTRQYLVAQRWLSYSETLQVWITPQHKTPPASSVAQGAVAFSLPSMALAPDSTLRYSEHSLRQLIPQLHAELPQAEGLHDWLAWKILRHWPLENHYAPAALRYRFLGNTLRRAAWGFGTAALLAGSASAGFSWLEQRDLQEQIRLAKADQFQLQQKLSVTTTLLPELPVSLKVLQSRMQVLHAIQAQHAPVRQFLLPISRALSAQPAVELRTLGWKRAAEKTNAAAAVPLASTAAASAGPVNPLNEPTRPWLIALDGRVSGANDAQQVQQQIAQLQQQLAQAGFTIKLLRSPANLDPNAALRAQLQRQANTPNTPLRATLSDTGFSMELQWIVREAVR